MGEAQPQRPLEDDKRFTFSQKIFRPNVEEKRRVSLCVGCGSQIHDQYILRVAPDLEWHAACLKCADCHQFLDETCTCFVRDGKTYCKRDYARLFGAKCAKCSLSFSKSDFVMRARNKIYHIDCFRCVACSRQLIPGDEFALREDGLFCKADHEVLETTSLPNGNGADRGDRGDRGGGGPTANGGRNGHGTSNGGHGTTLQMAFSDDETVSLCSKKSKKKTKDQYANAEPMQTNRSRDSVRPQVHKQNSEHKPTRVRTVLNEKQLHTLRTCYAANPRPDALMKEQLVEMTGLSPRVIRVWFQNKRCKDKKKSIMMKQIQQQEKYGYLDSEYSSMTSPDGRQLTLGSMRGVPMVATSPVRHESPLHVNPIEVQSYQPPWKALTEYAMQPDMDPTGPHFQQLVSQMHGYGDHVDSSHPLPVLLPGGGPPVHLSSYLATDDSLSHQPPSNMSSHLAGTPSDLSSPCTSE